MLKLTQLLSKMAQMQKEMLMAGRVNSPRLVSVWMQPSLCWVQGYRAHPCSPVPTAVMLSKPRAVEARLWGNPSAPLHAQPKYQTQVGGKCTEPTLAVPLHPSPADTELPAPAGAMGQVPAPSAAPTTSPTPVHQHPTVQAGTFERTNSTLAVQPPLAQGLSPVGIAAAAGTQVPLRTTERPLQHCHCRAGLFKEAAHGPAHSSCPWAFAVVRTGMRHCSVPTLVTHLDTSSCKLGGQPHITPA